MKARRPRGGFVWLQRSMNSRILLAGPVAVLLFGLTGCAPRNLPAHACLVGGGLNLEYVPTVDGTVIYRERTSGRMIATESVPQGGQFFFGPGRTPDWETIMTRLFADTTESGAVTLDRFPTNAFFELYFVPAPKK